MSGVKLAESFLYYCQCNPSLRFWQALRNWSGFASIIVTSSEQDKDTFYFEGKTK